MKNTPLPQDAAEETEGGLPPRTGSPSSDMVRHMLECLKAMGDLTNAARLMNKRAWALIAALTADPRDFPKAVKIGEIDTDVATIRIDGVTSEPLEILTGADGRYEIYADDYDEYGLPGRIIIDLGRGVKESPRPWTRVEDGLPEDGQEVWMFRLGVVHSGSWHAEQGSYFRCGGTAWRCDSNVTHWMPCDERPGVPLDPENVDVLAPAGEKTPTKQENE